MTDIIRIETESVKKIRFRYNKVSYRVWGGGGERVGQGYAKPPP